MWLSLPWTFSLIPHAPSRKSSASPITLTSTAFSESWCLCFFGPADRCHPVTCHGPVLCLTTPQNVNRGPPSFRSTRIKEELGNQWTFQLGIEKYVPKTTSKKKNWYKWIQCRCSWEEWLVKLVKFHLQRYKAKPSMIKSLPGTWGRMKIVCRLPKSYHPPRLSDWLLAPDHSRKKCFLSLPEAFQKHFGFPTLKALINIYIIAMGLCVYLLSPAEIYISLGLKHVFSSMFLLVACRW